MSKREIRINARNFNCNRASFSYLQTINRLKK